MGKPGELKTREWLEMRTFRVKSLGSFSYFIYIHQLSSLLYGLGSETFGMASLPLRFLTPFRLRPSRRRRPLPLCS